MMRGPRVFTAVLLGGLGIIAACSGGDVSEATIPTEPGPGGQGSVDGGAGGGPMVVGPDGAFVPAPVVTDLGHECEKGDDCQSLICTENKCQQPTSMDGVKNQEETDIDCGGQFAPFCDAGKGCVAARDCSSAVCGGGKCQPPSFTDGVKNGAESDVDCGGVGAPQANKCDVGKVCVQHTDCQSDGCGDDGKCAEGRSCTSAHGGRSCGAGEYGDPASTHESCCKEIRVPTRNVYLDKYNVTAGRMRAFIERVDGNVRAAVSADPKWVAAWTQYLPTNMNEALAQLGPSAQDWEWPAPGTAGFPRDIWAARGCQVNGGGSRTYWQPGTDAHKYPKETLDEKTLNCVTTSMLLAFCLWDGKDVMDPEDYKAAWVGNDNRAYPWGNNPVPPTTDYAFFNQAIHRFGYQYPAYVAPDATIHIAAPGRKPAGNGPFGHADLAGNIYEMTRRGGQVHYLVSGSWERHTIGVRGNTYSDATTPFSRRYYAIGGRCGRR